MSFSFRNGVTHLPRIVAFMVVLCFVLACEDNAGPQEEKEFTVTFNSNGGSAIAPIIVEKGNPIAKPADPSKVNSIFQEWYTDLALTQIYNFNNPVNTNTTLYAKWTESVTITFNSNQGSDVAAITVEKGQLVQQPEDPMKDGFAFKGWFTDEATTRAYAFSIPVTRSLTLYAQWAEFFTVTFDSRQGSTIEPMIVEQGQRVIEPPDPTLDRFFFRGWFIDEETTQAYVFNNAVVGDITLYAKWEFMFLKVRLKADATTELATQEVFKSGRRIYQKNPFIVDAQYITGYFTDVEKTMAFDFSNALTRDTILYINTRAVMVVTTKDQLTEEVNRAIALKGNTVDLNYIDTKDITNMDSIFFNKLNVNPDISLWNVGKVTSMKSMFQVSGGFNQDISNWDVSKVTNMSNMFNSASSFNINIGGWNVSNVVNMTFMFSRTTQFNQDISQWDVSNVANMGFMFERSGFNQNISTWAVDNVDDIGSMFSNAAQFNQDLTAWEDHLRLVNGKFTGYKVNAFQLSPLANNPPSWY